MTVIKKRTAVTTVHTSQPRATLNVKGDNWPLESAKFDGHTFRVKPLYHYGWIPVLKSDVFTCNPGTQFEFTFTVE